MGQMTISSPARRHRKSALGIAFLAVILALLIRIALYALLVRSGYFFGIPWDTFSRTDLAWQWAHAPYFSPADGYWVPLQFWIVGTVYRLLQPWSQTSTILIPVVVNNLFLMGSLLITYLVAQEWASPHGGTLAVLLAAVYAEDIFVSFSGLAEPILIFLILLTSYLLIQFVEMPETQRGFRSTGLGITAMLAAATHYVGWFLAVFVMAVVGVSFVQMLIAGRLRSAALHALGAGLCLLFPIIWMANNYRIWGDPLHFTHLASDLQASYAGSLPVLQRVVSVPLVLLQKLSAVAIVGVGAVWIGLLGRLRRTIYLSPAAFTLIMIWSSAVAGMAAPYQEPRYLVFVGWILFPFIAALLSEGLTARKYPLRIIAGAVIVAVATIGLVQTFSFSNSFGPDVQEVAQRAGKWLRQQKVQGRVILQVESAAERAVIPVVAGYPDRFTFVSVDVLRKEMNAPGSFLGDMTDESLGIVKDAPFAHRAESYGLRVDRVGDYFLIFRKPGAQPWGTH